MRDPFRSSGEWLRCALHAHTTRSDGELAPEHLVRHYERAGFDALAVTDHRVRTRVEPAGSLLVVAGSELDAVCPGSGRDAHVLAFGIEADPPAGEPASVAETAAWVAAGGGVAYLAHPYWSGLSAADVRAAEGVAGLEVWNAGCELEVGRGSGAVHWDDALADGRALHGLVTDDSHHPGFDSVLAWTWARCAERTPAAVVDALREGAFYGSAGPLIHEVAVADGAVEVACSPAARVTLVAGRKRGAAVAAGRLGYCYHGRALETEESGLVRRAELHRPPRAPYGRVEVVDAEGRKAWTNALWSAAP